jgi:hypothetical protein
MSVRFPCSGTATAYIKGRRETRKACQVSDAKNETLPAAAQRALAEAEQRRQASKGLDLPTELGGRDGPEPVRFGDWERKGIAVDF